MTPSGWLVLVLAAGCGGSGEDAAGEEDEAERSGPLRVRCVAATSAVVRDSVEVRGTIEAAPAGRAVVAPEVAGRLSTVNVQEGSPVHAGDLLATVDARQARDAAAQVQADLQRASATAHAAQLTRDRAARLVERGIAAQQELDDAVAAAQVAQAEVAHARAALDEATRMVQRAQVRAPIDGVVLHVLESAGQLVDGTPATPVVEIADPTAQQIAAQVPPEDLVRLRPAADAEARFDAVRDPVPASVVLVSPAVDPVTGQGMVRIALHPRSPLPFGLLGVVAISVGEHRGLTVPALAVRAAGGLRSEVVVCDGAHARVREVEVGARPTGYAEILSGLRPGERVAVDHVTALEDGDEIAVVTPPADARAEARGSARSVPR